MNEQQLARGLGWFSIGLGLAELLAPRQVGRAIGVGDRQRILRLMGIREIASGIGILRHQRPQAAWLWSRVAGDAMDLGSLAVALRGNDVDRRRVATAIAAVLGVTVLDVLCSLQLSRAEAQNGADAGPFVDEWGNVSPTRRGESDRKPVRHSITINRPAAEIYAFWRNFENLPRFMNHLKSVIAFDDKRSHWIAKGPADMNIEWDAEIVQEIPDELIAWQSLPGADVENSGNVTFETATGGRGTIVRVELRYRPPAGVIGATVAKLFGEAPEKQIPVDLLRIKQLLETGEITRTEGQPAGRTRSTSLRYDDFVRT
jgi:uncharacterized membrane protein